MKRPWPQTLMALALIWLGVAGVMHLTDDQVAWPEKVAALLAAAPWRTPTDGSAAERERYLGLVIANHRRLDDSQRRRLREDFQGSLDRFFSSLTEAEQKRYLDQTLEPYFDQIARGLERLPTEERKRLAARLRNDLKNLRSDSAESDRLNAQDREFMELMIAEDPLLFLREAPLKVKMELAPVIEDLQARLRGARR